MAKDFTNEIKTMTRLINYGLNENKVDNSSSVIEYQSVGADGKNYAIIRECNKYYIKVAPKKNTKLMTEDYDYIGGFNNKKDNEYKSYNVASKQFELKMKALNEQYDVKPNVSNFAPKTTSEWQTSETKGMREEINRFNTIMNNVNGILSEDRNFAPYTETAKPQENKDVSYSKPNPTKDGGSPFTFKPCTNGKCKKSEDVYSEPSVGVEDSIAGVKKSGGHKFLGSTATKKTNCGPYSEKPCKPGKSGVCVYESVEDIEDVDIDDEAPVIDVDVDVEDDAPVIDVDVDDSFDNEQNIDTIDNPSDDQIQSANDEFFKYFNDDYDDDDDAGSSYYDLDDIYDSRKRTKRLTESEFGKHPRYRKQPMTLPPNNTTLKKGTRMWKPKTDNVDEPFGQRIGSSAPYTNNTIENLTDMICDKLLCKKKI